jgi:RNA polymerase sigma-70 factor (ECF subfamily)
MMNMLATAEDPHVVPSGAVPIDLEYSFESFYRREYSKLLAIATALSGSFEDGEDIVQDTLFAALIRWDKVGRLQRPGGWCHRVLLNRCRGWWRRRTVRLRHGALACRPEPLPGPEPDFIGFWAAVRDLPERPRHVVVLRYIGEHTTTEIAEILDIPHGTVRSDLTRARAALTHAMEHTP